MACNFIKVNVVDFIGDRINYVADNLIKSDSAKAKIILGSRISEDFTNFVNFLTNYLIDKGYKKENGESFYESDFTDQQSIVDNISTLKGGVNIINGALFAYYKHIYKSVDNYNTIQKSNNTLEFLTITAEDEAVNWVASKLSESIYKNKRLSQNNRLTSKQLFKSIEKGVFNNIKNSIYITTKELLSSQNKLNGGIKETINEIESLKEIVSVLEDIINKYKNEPKENVKNYVISPEALFDKIKDNTYVKNLLESYKANNITEFKIEDINKNFIYFNERRENLILSFISKYGNEIAKNNVALYKALRNDYFQKRVINHKQLYGLNEEVNDIFDENVEVLEDESESYIYEAESIDETTKRWNENVKQSFMSYVDSDMRYKLGQIRKADKYCPYSEYKDIKKRKAYYDTNNQLGLETTYDVQEVITQLINYANFNSIGELINSIDNIAKVNPALYGFSFLAHEMRSDFAFASSLWRNLAKPVVRKNMILISMEGSIDSVISNKNNTPRNSQINYLLNQSKASFRNFDENHLNQIRTYIYSIQRSGITNTVKNGISEIIRYYFPNITESSITNMLSYNNTKQFYAELLTDLGNFLDSYNEKQIEIDRALADLKDNKAILVKRLYDVSSYPNAIKSLIDLGDKLYKYCKNDTELNTFNAEMNLSTDLLNNCYISRIFQSIHNNDRTSLQTLGEEIAKCPQYAYSPIFFGVEKYNNVVPGLFIKSQSPDGKVQVKINEDGVRKINYALFNGIRTEDFNQAVLYNGMTEGDYFMTILNLYFKPSYSETEANDKGFSSKKDNNDKNVCEVFLPTPSDAPKNFTMLLPNYRFTYRNVKTVHVSAAKNHKILVDKEQNYLDILNVNKDKDVYISDIDDATKTKIQKRLISSKNYLHSISEEELDDLLNAKIKDSIKTAFTINGSDVHPVLYTYEHLGADNTVDYLVHHVILVSGDIYETKKDKENETKSKSSSDTNAKSVILNRPEIKGILSFKQTNKNISEITDNDDSLPKTLIDINKNTIIEDYILNEIKTNKNVIDDSIFKVEDTPMREVFKQIVYGELNAITNGLNAVFEDDVNDASIKVLKKNINDLTDVYHYNRDGLSKDGKLTGKVFKFNKLFDIKIGDNIKYSANDELLSMLSLYGGVDMDKFGIIRQDIDGGLYIDTNELSKNKDSFITINDNGEFILQLSNVGRIEQIVDKWMKLFSYYTMNEYQQYRGFVKNSEYTYENVLEAMFGNVIANFNSTDLFYGDDTFYFDSRTFFKRAKEAQAGGHAYSLYEINDNTYNEIRNLDKLSINKDDYIDLKTDADKKFTFVLKEQVGVDEKGKPKYIEHEYRLTENNENLLYRNGFNAATINNVEAPIEKGDSIYDELLGIYKKEGINEVTARRLASTIANVFGRKYEIDEDGNKKEIKGKKTKVDDAQSYITFEEFIMRKVADGTIDEYKDIITQILEVRAGYRKLSEIDLDYINTRIQVQKNFYFDMIYDDVAKVRRPRQIKNAEFVLIPELLGDSSLAELYHIMRRNNIQQINTVETSKASKSNILTFWDNNGKAHPEEFEASISKESGNTRAIESFYYKYLYKQQDVVQHMVDEENKAGIQISKKLIDNATPETMPFVKQFLDNYCANIESSFNELLYACGWKLNSNGTLSNLDGSKISFEYFNEKAKREAARLGLDTNFVEYFELDEYTKQPKLPNWMNNVSAKIESINNGIFNNMVTRQTLPGWHGAQVTSVGFADFIKDEKGVTKELKYHPEVKDENGKIIKSAVVEIMVPRWSSLLKGLDIKKIEEEGLDTMIIYRMPTEGKQSVAIAKVVGILPDTYGSSVVVPAGWVTQTGSDFDVDSIYAITKEMRRAFEDGVRKVKAVKPYDFKNEEDNIKAYIDYVKNLIDIKLKKGFYLNNDEDIVNLQDLKDTVTQLKTDYASNKKDLKEATTIFRERIKSATSKDEKGRKTALGGMIRGAFHRIDNDENNFVVIGEEKHPTVEYYNNILKSLQSILKAVHDKDKKKVQNLIKRCEIVIELKQEQENIATTKKETINKIKEESFNNIKKIAKKENIISFEDFVQLPNEMKQSKKARNNAIVEAMISIMEHEDSREENYSTSNFRDIEDAIKDVNDLTGRSSTFESPYNPFTQIRYFNDAMSGAKLKAFSVTRDNGNSIFNYTKAVLKEPIIVRYHEDNGYDLKEINNSYDGTIDVDAKTIEIVHHMLAHSKNKRNVVQRLITVYGSETTAHILDAIKSGPILNENVFTFGTFKTLIDVGVDYTTAIGWLALPGITEICNKYYDTNSIYSDGAGNPIHRALREIARRGNIMINGKKVNEFTSYKSIVTYFKDLDNTNKKNKISIIDNNGEVYSESIENIAKRLGYDLNSSEMLPLDTNLIRRRLSNKEDKLSELESIVFDYITIMQFEKVNNITKKIENLIRVSNPDKFGAKQTNRETFEILYKINSYRNQENTAYEEDFTSAFYTNVGNYYEDSSNSGDIIMIGDKYYIDAIYPLNSKGEIDVKASAYPYLAAYLKYSTIPSVNINRELFELEAWLIDNEYNYTTSQHNLIGRKFTNEEFKAFKQYIVTNIYHDNKILTNPLIINKEGELEINTDVTRDDINLEIARIKGNETLLPSVINSFTVYDLDNVTDEEVKTFMKLTPAQKVLAIQRLFKDNSGIFAKMTVDFSGRLSDIKKGVYGHKIRINTQNESIEELYKMFNQIATSKHKLVKLAAIDLIKYAFIVEGFRFKKDVITKIITNKTIKDENLISFNGQSSESTDIVANCNNILQSLINTKTEDVPMVYERFIRSNSEMVPLNTAIMRVGSGKNRGSLQQFTQPGARNSYYIPFEEKEVISTLIERYGEDANDLPNYIRLKHKIPLKRVYEEIGEDEIVGYTTVNQLFKPYIIPNKGIFLLGLAKLDANEVSDVSANSDNNHISYGEEEITFINPEQPNAINALYSLMLTKDINLKQQFLSIIQKNATVRNYNTKTSRNEIYENYIIDNINNENHAIRAEINTFINELEYYVNKGMFESETNGEFSLFLPNAFLNSIVNKNVDKIPLNVIINGKQYKISISKASDIQYKKLYAKIKNTKIPLEKLDPSTKYAYIRGVENNTITDISKLFNIKIIEQETYDTIEDSIEERFSTIPGINFIENGTLNNNPFNTLKNDSSNEDIDFVSNIIYNLTREGSNVTDPYTENIKQFIRFNNVEISSSSSIFKNKEELMNLIKEYYENKSKYFINRFGNFFESEVNSIAIDSDEMIKALNDNPEVFNQLIRFLLEARTFGKSARKFIANVDTGNTQLNNDMQTIINSITKVISDTRLNKAYRRVFNDYIANRFSDNPNIKLQILDLSTSFDDATFIDSWIADIGELSNKQVQVVFNQINNVLNSVQRLVIPEQQAKFSKEFDNYSEGIDWSKIIDISTGKFVREYTDEYIEDKRLVVDNERIARQHLEIAKNNYENAINNQIDVKKYTKEYEEAILNYQEAHYQKLIWFADNVEQEITSGYYKHVANNLSYMLHSSFRKEFGTYLRLQEELKKYSKDANYYTKEEATAINKIKNQIRNITNPSLKINLPESKKGTTEYIELKERLIVKNDAQYKAFKTYINTKKSINDTYFNTEINQEWLDTRNANLQIIKEFEENNPDLTFAQKMNNIEYADAYNWLKANTVKTLDKEGYEKIQKYRRILNKGYENDYDAINTIIENAGAYDEFGEVDPSKLSEEDIVELRKLYSKKYEKMAEKEENGKLIKEIPAIPMKTDAYYKITSGFIKDNSGVREKLIKQINEIIIKGVNPKNNRIETELLWANTTEIERKELAKLYYKLETYKSDIEQDKSVIESLNAISERKINNEAFDREYEKAKTMFIGNRKDFILWKDIFCARDEDGAYILDNDEHVPNYQIYGYRDIKENHFDNTTGKYISYDKYRDMEKAEALDFIKHNTETIYIDKYSIAYNDALSKGYEEFNKWFKLNHFYNPITKEWEALGIWTKSEPIAGKELYKDNLTEDEIKNYLTEEEATYGYNPTFVNTKRSVNEQFINKPNGQPYNRYNENYKSSGRYDNPNVQVLTDNERNMKNLLMRLSKEYAFTNKAKNFVEKGFVPREYVAPIDAEFVLKQAGGLLGLDWIPSNKSWYDIEYNEDILPKQEMYELIRTKGFQEKKPYPTKPVILSKENIDSYNAEVEKIRKENEEIEKKNIELERKYRHKEYKDYKEIFLNVIANGEEYKAKQEVKDLVYFLIEDLKATDNTYSNKAYRRNRLTGKLRKKNRNVTNNDNDYLTAEQKRTLSVVENTARRILHKQYKEPHKLNTVAQMAQNFTSAKYMYANLPGGVTNVLIGWNNIISETLGEDYLDTKYVNSAFREYMTGFFDYVGGALTNNDGKYSSKAGAFIDLIRVVDYDAMLQRQPNEDLSKYITRLRSTMFIFQSSGEHFMQNVVGIGMAKSHRLYKSKDKNGKDIIKLGSFANYTWDIEQQAMKLTLEEIAKKNGIDINDLLQDYKTFINYNYNTIEELDKLDKFKTNINRDFLKNNYSENFKEYANIYINIRKELMKDAKQKFENEFESLYDQYELVDGKLTIKSGSILIGEGNKPIPEYESEIFGHFVTKVISVNKKIHGVYDKIGAARIEQYWFGSLAMQYHKHIYPGIMKRFRGLLGRPYYNEFRQSVEKGSYVSFIEFMGTEFDGLLGRIDENEKGAAYALAIVKELFNSIYNTLSYLNINWNMLSEWERHNIKRILGDLYGMGAAFAFATSIYAISDDDEIKDSNLLSGALYVADSFYAQSQMYFPWGLAAEAKTLWSSPIAATNSITDFARIANVYTNILFDDEFNPYYTTGQYKGRHKAAVAFYRNIPIYRVFDRMSRFTTHNKYYRLGDVGMPKVSKNLANTINPDN